MITHRRTFTPGTVTRRLFFDVGSLRLLEGRLSPRALGLVMEWASQHQSELRQDWDLARESAPLKKIAPLQ